MTSSSGGRGVVENRQSLSSIRAGRPDPFYFGAPENQLYGCYHAPASGRRQNCAVLLCYPLGQEYIRAHRNYRQLALRLSNAHFPVLRFDLSGCGDSAADFTEASTTQWLADLSCAVGELRERCGVKRVCLIGLRLGGSLSMMAAVEGGDIDGLVLWDPIVSGQAYVNELISLHQAWLQHRAVKPGRKRERNNITEILGFPFTEDLLADLGQLDMLSIQRIPARHILIVESGEETGEGRALETCLKQMGCSSGYLYLDAPKVWLEGSHRGLVAHGILQAVVSWMSEVYP